MTQQRIHKFPIPLLTPFGMVMLSLVLPLSLLGLLADLSLRSSLSLIFVYLFIYVGVLIVERLSLSSWLKGFTFELRIPTSFFSGIESHLELRCAAHKRLPRARLQIRLEVPQNATPVEEVVNLEVGAEPLQFKDSYEITPHSRGKLYWSQAWFRVYRRWGLSLMQFQLEFKPPYETIVYPNHQVADDDVSKPLQHLLQGETAIEVRRGEGREFDSLRKYAVGDDLRRIDWKRSARGKGLLVRVFRPETHQRINLAIDCGRRMGNRVEKRLQLDYAVDAASCLFHMAARNDDECGLFAFNESVVSSVSCKKGKTQQLLLRDALTNLETGALESDYQLLAEWANSSRRRSLMLLITSVSSPAGLESIKRAFIPIRRRHLPLVFAVADEDLEDVVTQSVVGLTDAYVVGAARQQQLAIQERADQLTRFGIDCIYCRASELPLRLRYKYQELKASGRL